MTTNTSQENLYCIPKKYRIVENLHIFFWLIKDLCWCIIYKPLGIAMIFPTLFIAAYIVWQNRIMASELYHNLAVLFWIIANSYWMISEFFGFDEQVLLWKFTGKNLALIPFSIGIAFLLIYYLFILPKKKKT